MWVVFLLYAQQIMKLFIVKVVITLYFWLKLSDANPDFLWMLPFLIDDVIGFFLYWDFSWTWINITIWKAQFVIRPWLKMPADCYKCQILFIKDNVTPMICDKDKNFWLYILFTKVLCTVGISLWKEIKSIDNCLVFLIVIIYCSE